MAAATKRDINRLKKQSADLWVALTDVECNVNLVIGHLLGGEAELGADLTIQQAERLKAAREALNKFDADLAMVMEGVS